MSPRAVGAGRQTLIRPGGRWYPKKIVTHGRAESCDGTVTERQSLTTILLDTRPTFPDGLFDPARLPK
jgi:hypothetical protein